MTSSGPILLVEDSQDDQELIKRALARLNVANRVDLAGDGQHALELLQDPGRSLPALLLLDLKLPKVNGFEVLERVRSDPRTRHLPVVVMSSSSEMEDITRAYDLGANSYIRKPVSIAQFNEALRQVANYWLGLNETAVTG